MSEPRYCIDCKFIRRSWSHTERCAAMRMSWIDPQDESELYPCVAVNVDGKCRLWKSKREPQGKLFDETT